MRSNPTLSVVIPVKDDAVLLERCLTAMDRQTVTPLEVIVVDNGSTDDGARVALRHGATVIVEATPGIAAAASAGYDTARGDVVVRCDADTLAPPDWLARIERAFAADAELDALTGSGEFYDVTRWKATIIGTIYLRSYYLTAHAALAHPPLWGSNMAMRTSAWAGVAAVVHRDDADLHDDFDLAFALGPTARIRHDRTLSVGVSGRSLQGGPALSTRFARAFRTIAVNWAVMPPSRRWAIRLASPEPVPRPGPVPLRA